jgi:MFS family permease
MALTLESQTPTDPATGSVTRTTTATAGRTAALISLLLASTMELIDTTIVNVALPTIERDLGASGAQLQWMVAAYPLAFAVALVTGTRRRAFRERRRPIVYQRESKDHDDLPGRRLSGRCPTDRGPRSDRRQGGP